MLHKLQPGWPRKSNNSMGNFNTANDLINQLRMETEGAQMRKTPDVVDVEAEPVTTPSTDSEPTPLGNFEEPVKEVKEEIKTYTPDQAKATAISWVKKFSSIMKIIFAPLYRKTILAPGDEEKMRDFVRKNQSLSEKDKEAAIHSDHELSKVADRFDKYVKAIDDIPLNADEIEDLAQPLSELIIKYKNLQLGPEWTLAIAAGFITLPRLATLMPDLSKMFAGGTK